jgi:hypothetical protein
MKENFPPEAMKQVGDYSITHAYTFSKPQNGTQLWIPRDKTQWSLHIFDPESEDEI